MIGYIKLIRFNIIDNFLTNKPIFEIESVKIYSVGIITMLIEDTRLKKL